MIKLEKLKGEIGYRLLINGTERLKMISYEELATKYKTTPEKIKQNELDFVMSEGFDGAGNEYDTFFDWLEMIYKTSTLKITEPYQKGDLDISGD
jgi:hypothetical protein